MNWAKPFLKRHKYGANRTEHAGYSFASKLEAARFAELEFLRLAGEVLEIKVQPQVRLSDAQIIYKPDFLVTYADGSKIYEEVKGFETPEWRIKRRLWMAYGPGVLRIYKGSGTRLFLHEEIKGGGSNVGS